MKVINSRNRDREQFEMNVESIDSVGLLKPIRVNDKFLELIGRVRTDLRRGTPAGPQAVGPGDGAWQRSSPVLAKRHLLQSLIENIARTKPGSMDFARELKRLHDEGWSLCKILPVFPARVREVDTRVHPAG